MSDFSAFYKKYVELNLKSYFEIDFEINKLVILLTIALVIACIVISRRQNAEALILKKLLRAEAISEENAKSASELGLAENRLAISILSSSSGYFKTLVSRVGEKKMSYEDYKALENERRSLSPKERRAAYKSDSTLDIKNEKFYISKSLEEKAKRVFFKNTTSPLKTALFCILIVSVGAAVFFLMPEILSFL